jgi:hypothetical protein
VLYNLTGRCKPFQVQLCYISYHFTEVVFSGSCPGRRCEQLRAEAAPEDPQLPRVQRCPSKLSSGTCRTWLAVHVGPLNYTFDSV